MGLFAFCNGMVTKKMLKKFGGNWFFDLPWYHQTKPKIMKNLNAISVQATNGKYYSFTAEEFSKPVDKGLETLNGKEVYALCYDVEGGHVWIHLDIDESTITDYMTQKGHDYTMVDHDTDRRMDKSDWINFFDTDVSDYLNDEPELWMQLLRDCGAVVEFHPKDEPKDAVGILDDLVSGLSPSRVIDLAAIWHKPIGSDHKVRYERGDHVRPNFKECKLEVGTATHYIKRLTGGAFDTNLAFELVDLKSGEVSKLALNGGINV